MSFCILSSFKRLYRASATVLPYAVALLPQLKCLWRKPVRQDQGDGDIHDAKCGNQRAENQGRHFLADGNITNDIGERIHDGKDTAFHFEIDVIRLQKIIQYHVVHRKKDRHGDD